MAKNLYAFTQELPKPFYKKTFVVAASNKKDAYTKLMRLVDNPAFWMQDYVVRFSKSQTDKLCQEHPGLRGELTGHVSLDELADRLTKLPDWNCLTEDPFHFDDDQDE